MGFIPTKTVNAKQELTPHDSMVVEYNYGLISIHATGISLEKLLCAIGNKANIQITLYGDFSDKVNLSVTSTSLENVIQWLVHDWNNIIIYASNKNTNHRPIEKIYLFNRTQDSEFKFEITPPKVLEELALLAKLALLPDDEAIPALAKKLTEKKNQVVTQLIIENLINIGGDIAANALAEGLVDDREQIRTDIVTALGQLDNEQASLILAQVMYGDPDPQTRAAAVEQLASFTTEPTQAFLKAASLDKDEQVQLEAQYAIEIWKFGQTSPLRSTTMTDR